MGYQEFRTISRPTVKQVQLATCAHYGIRLSDMLSDSREWRIVTPRHVAIVLAHQMTMRTSNLIGREFKRHHSIIFHALDKIERNLPAYADDIAAIKGALGEDAERMMVVAMREARA